jgi:RimJ/RimL family protein N-acetyltransferase
MVDSIAGLDMSVDSYYEKGTPISFETEDLLLRSAQESDRAAYQQLFSDPETMAKYADNESRLKEQDIEVWKKEQTAKADDRVDTYIRRWTVEKDPFSGFAIFLKANNEFIGHVVAGHGKEKGQSCFALIISKDHWHKGYGTQAAKAIFHQYLPALMRNHYQRTGEPLPLDGAPFSEVSAVARVDQAYGRAILEKCGLAQTGEKEIWGSPRAVYAMRYAFRKEEAAAASGA